uniref:Annexin n=1 Tax=Myxobolus squamalis TaxID=59785 RepID=A0A6B2G194_MYXSQ
MPIPMYPVPSQDAYGQQCPHSPQRITPKYIDCSMAIPSLRPILDASPLSDAYTLYKAFKGIGCDKKVLLNIVTHRTCYHREQIKREYLRMYGKSLIQRTESELRDPLERVVVSLLYSGADLDAYTLRKATKGLGTDESALMHILCTRSSFQISKIKESYRNLFGRSLQDHITSDTSGSFKKILLCLLNEPRDQSNFADPAIAAQQVSEIYSRCSVKMKAPENLIPIFCKTNYNQLRLTFEKFQSAQGKTIYRYVKEFFEGDYERTLMTICNYVINPFHYFSKHLKLGIINGDINQVIRVVCTRCEIDLTNILNDYKIIFGTDAATDIKNAFELQHRETVVALLMLIGQQ